MRHLALKSLGIGGALVAGVLGYHVLASDDPLWAATLSDIAASWGSAPSPGAGPSGSESVNVEFVVNQCSPLVAEETLVTATLPKDPVDAGATQTEAAIDAPPIEPPAEVAALQASPVVQRPKSDDASFAKGFILPVAPHNGAPIQMSPSILYLP